MALWFTHEILRCLAGSFELSTLLYELLTCATGHVIFSLCEPSVHILVNCDMP